MNKEHLKKALISILVGTAIALSTSLFNLLIDLLKNYQHSIIPIVTGVVHYMKTWKINLPA